MIAMDSSSASMRSPGVWGGIPFASATSAYAPEPRPRSTRPPVSRSRLATLRASTTGWRNGRLATSSVTRTDSVDAAITDRIVQASSSSGVYGWSWIPISFRPTCSVTWARAMVRSGSAATGVRKDPKVSSWP